MAIRAEDAFDENTASSPEDNFGDSATLLPTNTGKIKNRQKQRRKSQNRLISPKNDKKKGMKIKQSSTTLVSQQSNDIVFLPECGCLISDFKSCDSAKMVKILLKQLDKSKNAVNSDNEQQSDLEKTIHSNEWEIAQSLHSVLDENDYSVTKLMEYLHHLKYENNIDEDDALFDSDYEFFKESKAENGCDIKQCRFMERRYRDRQQEELMSNLEEKDELILDIMSMIHCYILHSYDTQRFNKEQRQIIMETTGFKSWKSVTDAIHGDDEKQSANTTLLDTVTSVLVDKNKKGRTRFRDQEEEYKSASNDAVNYTAMARTLGVDEKLLREGLDGYDRDSIISALVDVVYGENMEELPIWTAFEMEIMENKEKRMKFQNVLYRNFCSFQLSTANLMKLSRYIVERKDLQIDAVQMEKVMTSGSVDGRMFDKSDAEHYQSNGSFSKRFKSVPDCKRQHVGQLYTAVRKWKYVEVKKVVIESKEEEKEDDIVTQVNGQQTKSEEQEQVTSEQPVVYAIGKPFNFWQEQHDDYVKAKYKDMKEEALYSPLISKAFPGQKGWKAFMKAVAAMIRTKAALKITSTGRSMYLYGIQIGQPFDDKHLCSLKLYTDYSALCAAFCSIFRGEDSEEVAEVANWARYLIETVQCFGTLLSAEKANKIYYRGVNRTFMFMTIVSRFNLPMSTTSSVKCISSKFSRIAPV